MQLAELDRLKVNLGGRIKQLRESQGLKVRQFALIADIEHPQLINIEKGRVDLKLATLHKIATALNIEIQELFDFSDLNNS